jgi:hypothetical protein
MTPDRLTALLRTGPVAPSGQTPECPDEHKVAAYVDGALDVPACERLERHAADCDHCIALIGALCRERKTNPGHPSTQPAISPTRGHPADRTGRHRRLPRWWAAAAALALATPLLVHLGGDRDAGLGEQGSPASPSTRSVVPDASGLRVLSPGPGSIVDVGRLTFSWTEIPGTPYYDVRIVTDAGDVIARQRVTSNRWRPERLDLDVGAEYFVIIEAYPSGDKAISSRHVPFRVTD